MLLLLLLPPFQPLAGRTRFCLTVLTIPTTHQLPHTSRTVLATMTFPHRPLVCTARRR